MKSRIIHYLTFSISIALFCACGDWTEVKSIGLENNDMEQTYPELYGKYTAKLREYKKSEHYMVFGWFDNSVKSPITSRAQIIADIPDSLDVLTLSNPDNLNGDEVNDIKKLQNEKGTKVILGIDYSTIETEYLESKLEDEIQEKGTSVDLDGAVHPIADDYISFMEKKVDQALALVEQYGYDGITLNYSPVAIQYVPKEEKEQFIKCQTSLLEKVLLWRKNNESKMMNYYGTVSTVAGKEFLDKCDYLLLSALAATSIKDIERSVSEQIVDGVPTDRIVITTTSTSLDNEDLQTGYLSGKNAIAEIANWCLSAGDGYVKAGMGIHNINNDYYNIGCTYWHSRHAISIINPPYKD